MTILQRETLYERSEGLILKNKKATLAKKNIMEVKQSNNEKKGSFFVEVDNKVEAEMTYVWAGPQKIIIDHTEVSEKLKGQSAGKWMLEKAVQFARENGIKILPLCPFAKSVFDKTPEYSDVLF